MKKTLLDQFRKIRQDMLYLQHADNAVIISLLENIADLLAENSSVLLKANAVDISKKAPDDPKVDRLLLTEERIANIVFAIKKIAKLPDPTGKILYKKKSKDGLKIEKVSVPLGVIGVIYESRPNVTFDVAALCLRSRNACILKGSSDAENTNHAAMILIKRALRNNGLPSNLVSMVDADRAIVKKMLDANKLIDLIIPRGSAELIQFVKANTQIPIIETGAGVCHTYIHKSADIDKAVSIVINAKVGKPAACNALDTILIDKSILDKVLVALIPALAEHKIGVWASPTVFKKMQGYPYLHKATEEDFDTEYLSLNLGIKMVKDLKNALDHIAQHSTKHSEAIIAEDKKAIQLFIDNVDAAAVYANASTRFTDGEVFGLGAEIGISTQKLHARGPFALEKLVTEKWIVNGNGQIR